MASVTDLERETAIATQKHIELVMHHYSRTDQLSILRGRLLAFGAAYSALVGPKHAFDLYTEFADNEVWLQLPPSLKDT